MPLCTFDVNSNPARVLVETCGHVFDLVTPSRLDVSMFQRVAVATVTSLSWPASCAEGPFPSTHVQSHFPDRPSFTRLPHLTHSPAPGIAGVPADQVRRDSSHLVDSTLRWSHCHGVIVFFIV